MTAAELSRQIARMICGGWLVLAAFPVCAANRAAFAPGFFWILDEKLDPKTYFPQLEDMAAHGARHVCPHPWPKGFTPQSTPSRMEPDYLTDGYLDFYSSMLDKAAALGMKVWLYDEGGWPSGGACGQVLASDPDRFAARFMRMGANGPEVRIVPYDRRPGRDAQYPSVIEKGVAEKFIQLTHERLASRCARHFGKTVLYAFTDEPAFPMPRKPGEITWCADFAEQFRRYHGYDVMPHVPALCAGATDAETQRVRVDYFDTLSRLFLERYVLPIRDWCRAHGIKSGGHFGGEDNPFGNARYGYGHILRALRGLDVPGVDAIWRQLYPGAVALPPGQFAKSLKAGDRRDFSGGQSLPFPRYASSIAHQAGGCDVLSESYAVYGPGLSPEVLKWIADYQMVRGVTHFVFSAYYGRWEGGEMLRCWPIFDPVNPQWDDMAAFFRDVERKCEILARGRSAARTAVYYDVRGIWATGGREVEPVAAHLAAVRKLEGEQRDFDFVDDDALEGATVGADGLLHVGAARYAAVVLPTADWLTADAKKSLDAFRAAGGAVIRGVDDCSAAPKTCLVEGEGAADIRAMKRDTDEGPVYFLVNEATSPRTVKVTLEGRAPFTKEFPAYGSELFRWRTLSEGWTMRRLATFVAGRERFELHEVNEEPRPAALGDWRAQLGPSFSGRVRYECAVDSKESAQAVLDLGVVKGTVRAYFNGRRLADSFTGPFRWRVSLQKGRNLVAVEVANSPVNQIGDESVRDRIIRDQSPRALSEKRTRRFNRDGRESGRYGPVRLDIEATDASIDEAGACLADVGGGADDRGFGKDALEHPDTIRFPGLFWKWDGKLTDERLEREMDDMAAHGALTPCIHPYPKAFWPGGIAKEDWQEPDYMTPGHLDLLEKMVRRGAGQGLKFWLYDEGGWPSGSANGEVMKSNPAKFALRIVRMGKDGKASVETVPQNPNWAAPYPSLIERGVAEKFVELAHGRWKERLGDEFGKSILFAFTDEPQMPSRKENQLPWCTDFAERFREAKGYDVMPYLDDLAAWSNRNERVADVRIDFWDVASTLFADRYLGTLRKWCRANGVLSGGHLDNEHDPGIYRNHGHTLRALRQFDVPGVDVIFRQLFPDSAKTRTPFPKYASSVAHQAGGRYVLSESFAIYGPSTTPDEIRWLVDYQLVRGVNLFVFSSYSPKAIGQAMNGTGGLFGPTNPQWDFMEPFMRRTARCCEMLSRGEPVVETAVFYDMRGVWVGGAEGKETLDRHYGVSAALLSRQSDFDFIDDDQIAAAPEPADGKLCIGKMSYSTVVLPTARRMLPAAKDKLARFVAAGGRVVEGDDFSAVPRTLNVALADGRPVADVRVMKRFDGARTLYFVVNESRRPASVRMAFAERGDVVCADPETCRFDAVARAADGAVAWNFRGCDSAIFVIGAKPDAEKTKVSGKAVEVADGWEIAPLKRWEIGEREFKVVETPHAKFAPTRLGDWRKALGETFCGTARYRATFRAEREGAAEIDFGKVCGCGSLSVNGKTLGARFTGPYRWRVDLRKGDNEIVLTVASTLVNLVKDERQREEIYRKFPPVSFFEKFYRRFNRQGHESGLFGPVRVCCTSVPEARMTPCGETQTSMVQPPPGYNAWPMVQTIGGRAVCIYSRGSGHTVNEGARDAYARTSTDGGRTWSPEVCFANDPAVCEGAEGRGLDENGAMVFWVRIWGMKRRGHELYRTADGLVFEKISTPVLSPWPMQITEVLAVPGKGLMSLWFAGDYKNAESGHAWRTLTSTDNGRTWAQRTVEGDLPRAEWPTEISAVHLGGGRILAIARAERGAGCQFQLTSTDGGETWRRTKTNITDVRESTPSLIFDPQTGLVANYYYQRGARKLKRRVAAATDIFDRPMEWPEPEILAEGGEKRVHDAGNVNATACGENHLLVLYSGTDRDCAVFSVSVPAPARKSKGKQR